MGSDKTSRTEKESFIEEAIFGDHHHKTTISEGGKSVEGRGRTSEESQKIASEKWDKSWGSDSSSSSGGGEGSSSSGCFLTTACTQWAGLPDNCEILQVFRDYRDHFMMVQPDRAKLASRYYELSPKIVERIEKDPNKDKVLSKLYNYGILPAFKKIKAGDLHGAMKLYSSWTEKLASTYGLIRKF